MPQTADSKGRLKNADGMKFLSLCPAPVEAATRRMDRDTGVFFSFVFLHAEENEQLEVSVLMNR
jgi:hypothetical protein